MKKRSIISMILIVLQVLFCLPWLVFAEENENRTDTTVSVNENAMNTGIAFLEEQQEEAGNWGNYGRLQTADITDILEYIYYKEPQNRTKFIDLINNGAMYFEAQDIRNNDDLAKYLLVDQLSDECYFDIILEAQNSDGGFGLSKGYSSDIIDTKIVLKMLADIDETESMTKAALYIVSLQNEDGGFSYQQGLVSNPELSAEIANILADCIAKDETLSYSLSGAITELDEYLNSNMVTVDELSSDDLSVVYQHFYTALFGLKMEGSYNITPYYALQSENGSVFDDPMATALFLELMVREQNTLVANLEYISITNDKGYSLSSFNANENINIEIGSEYETEKAYLSVTIETPSGEIIPLDSENLVWNTEDFDEGTYFVSFTECVKITERMIKACNKDDDYKAPHEQYNEIGKTIITCFENKDTETLISLFSENMKSSHDLETEIERAFDLLDSEIVEYGEIHSSVGGGDIREEGYVEREGGGSIDDVITESGTKYIIGFKIRDIDKDNEESVGVMNIWIINQDMEDECGYVPERIREIGEQ